jgi:hypothetical protein
MRAATSQARNRPSNFADTRKLSLTTWTLVKKAADALANGERQIVAARLAGDSKIAASISPFIAVRRNAPTAGAELRQQMREFMSQGAIDLREMLAQARIQRNHFCAIIRAARAGF